MFSMKAFAIGTRLFACEEELKAFILAADRMNTALEEIQGRMPLVNPYQITFMNLLAALKTQGITRGDIIDWAKSE